MKVDETLDARHKTYGTFQTTATLAQEIKRTLRGLTGVKTNWDKLDDDQQEALDHMATKMARILTGNPAYPDNWHDIAGYATLVVERLDGKAR